MCLGLNSCETGGTFFDLSVIPACGQAVHWLMLKLFCHVLACWLILPTHGSHSQSLWSVSIKSPLSDPSFLSMLGASFSMMTSCWKSPRLRSWILPFINYLHFLVISSSLLPLYASEVWMCNSRRDFSKIPGLWSQWPPPCGCLTPQT